VAVARKYISSEQILAWIQRHRQARPFGTGDIVKALKLDAKNGQAVSSRLRSLEKQGLLKNITPSKKRMWKYQITKEGLAGYTGIPVHAQRIATDFGVRLLKEGLATHFPQSSPSSKIDRILTILEAFASEWGIKV
jgi:hypothetical protein